MTDSDAGRWIWIVAGAIAVAAVAAGIVVASITEQRGMVGFGLLAGGAVLVFVYAMSSVVAQNACEACGIGNPPGASTCWKCGAALPMASGPKQGEGEPGEDE